MHNWPCLSQLEQLALKAPAGLFTSLQKICRRVPYRPINVSFLFIELKSRTALSIGPGTEFAVNFLPACISWSTKDCTIIVCYYFFKKIIKIYICTCTSRPFNSLLELSTIMQRTKKTINELSRINAEWENWNRSIAIFFKSSWEVSIYIMELKPWLTKVYWTGQPSQIQLSKQSALGGLLHIDLYSPTWLWSSKAFT